MISRIILLISGLAGIAVSLGTVVLRLNSLGAIGIVMLCLAAGASICLLIAAVRGSAELRSNVSVALTSCVLCAYAMEYAVGAFLTPPSKLDEVDRLQNDGVDAKPAHPWAVLSSGTLPTTTEKRQILPLGGRSRAVTVYCKEAGDFLTFTSDRYGFSNPDAVWDGPVSVMMVGDSFTQGACVPTSKSIAARLREVAPQTVNLGQGGNGPMTMLASLREYGPRLKPGLTLWFLFEGNDLLELEAERKSPILNDYLKSPDFSQNLMEHQNDVDHFLDSMSQQALADFKRNKMISFILLRGLREKLKLGISPMESAEYDPSKADFVLLGNILKTAQQTVQSWGGKIVFIYLPDHPSRPMSEQRGIAHKKIISSLDAANLPVIDIRTIMESRSDFAEMFACDWCHFNEKGYLFVADAIIAARLFEE